MRTPHTLRPTLYTLHFTPYALHPTRYTFVGVYLASGRGSMRDAASQSERSSSHLSSCPVFCKGGGDCHFYDFTVQGCVVRD